MNVKYISTALIVFSIAVSAMAEPSKGETVKFIVSKWNEVPKTGDNVRLSFGSEGCILFITSSTNMGGDEKLEANLNLVGINKKNESRNNSDYLELSCISGQECIKSYYNNKKKDYTYSSQTLSIYNNTTATKLEHAFLHLKSLCGGVKELF